MKDVLKRSLLLRSSNLLFFLIISTSFIRGQDFYVLDSSLLEKHLTILASDAMEGRETGTAGQKKAADYIRYNMKYNGLVAIDADGDYYQEFVLSRVSWDTVLMSLDGEKMELRKDWVIPSHPNSSTRISTDEIYFLGYGIDDNRYSDYRGNRVRGKVIMIKMGEPKVDSSYLLTGTTSPSLWNGEIQEKLEIASRSGVRAVLIIGENLNNAVSRHRSSIFYQRLIIDSVEEKIDSVPPYAYISEDLAERIIDDRSGTIHKRLARATETGHFNSVKLKVDNFSLVLQKNIHYIFTENVVGLLEGKNDPGDGYVIVSAHYDHLGKRGNTIYNGADDDGSGCAAILSFIDEFSQREIHQKVPQKSILFIFMTGEEKGLLGSRYYVNNPLLPLENAYTDINIDMIGRKDKRHMNGNYIYAIGADRISKELDTLIRDVRNNTTDLKLDYTYNAPDDPNRFYYRSDHYNFAKKGIPVVFFFSGVHEDYHQPTDTENKILYGPYTERVKFIFNVVKAAANRDDPFQKKSWCRGEHEPAK